MEANNIMKVERIYKKEIAFESVFKDLIDKIIDSYLQKSGSHSHHEEGENDK